MKEQEQIKLLYSDLIPEKLEAVIGLYLHRNKAFDGWFGS